MSPPPSTPSDAETRRQAERTAFLLALCDALRPLTEPAEVHAVGAAHLVRRFGAERMRWWDLEQPPPDAAAAGTDLPLDDLAPGELGALSAGTSVATGSAGTRLLVPVRTAGRLRAVVALERRTPLTPDEAALAEAAVERLATSEEHARVVARARAAGERLQVALDAARIGTFVWDPITDRTEADDQLAALLTAQSQAGLSLSESLVHLVHPDERGPVADAVAAGLDPGGSGRMDRVIRLRPDRGSITHLRVTWRAEFAGEGAERRAVRVVGAAIDVSEQERARDELRRAAERDAFRVALTDALRAAERPEAMQQAALELLTRRLGACRALIADIAADQAAVTVAAQCCDGAPPLTGTYRLRDFGPVVAETVSAGRRLVVDDVHALATTPAQHAAFATIGARAIVMTPPIRDDAGTTYLAVHHLVPHAWTDEELSLVDEVAERLRTAVQRARAEASLRETGTRLQVAQDATRVGFLFWDPIADRTEHDERAKAIFGDLTGVSLWEAMERAIHPDDRQPYLERVRRAIDPASGGRYHHVLRVVRPGAPLAWVAVTGQLLFEGEGRTRRAVRVVATVTDVTERVQAEQALRHATEHDRYLAALTGALRPLGDAGAVQRTAAQVLGRHLGVSRAFYADVTDGWGRIREEHRSGVPSVIGRHRLHDLGRWIAEDLRDDHTVVIADVLSDERVAPDEAKAFLDRSVRAVVAVPLVKDGRLVALLGLHQNVPRRWTAGEVALAEDTAERTWAAVERARAQAALRARVRPRRRG